MAGWTCVWVFALPTFKKNAHDHLQVRKSLWKLVVACWNIDAIFDICKLSFFIEWQHINSSSTKEGIKYRINLSHLPMLSTGGFFLLQMKGLPLVKDYTIDTYISPYIFVYKHYIMK